MCISFFFNDYKIYDILRMMSNKEISFYSENMNQKLQKFLTKKKMKLTHQKMKLKGEVL